MLGEVYKAPYYSQKGYGMYHVSPYMTGYGLGDTIRKFSQYLVPIFKSGSKAVGKQVLQSTSNVIKNLANNQDNKSFQELLKSEKNQAIDQLGAKALNKIKNLTGGGKRKRKRVTAVRKNKNVSKLPKVKKGRRIKKKKLLGLIKRKRNWRIN